jgi:hypothetical protein
MNTNDRATLRKWMEIAWYRSGQSWYIANEVKDFPKWEHKAKRWARFAVACERKLKEIEG